MYKFCNDNIKGIRLFIVNGDTMNSIHAYLVERFQTAKVVSSTRNYQRKCISQSMKMLWAVSEYQVKMSLI